MAQNITLQIMWNPPTHTLTEEKEAKGRYVKGAIVGNYLTSDLPEAPSPNSRLVFVHMKEVPDSYTVLNNLSKPKAHIDGENTIIDNRRQWIIDTTLFQQATRDTLDIDREITKIWNANYKLMIKKVGESVTIADEDLQ